MHTARPGFSSENWDLNSSLHAFAAMVFPVEPPRQPLLVVFFAAVVLLVLLLFVCLLACSCAFLFLDRIFLSKEVQTSHKCGHSSPGQKMSLP